MKPLHAELFAFIRARTRAKVFFHSCGAIRELIPDLIEIGVDILNPVQVSAAGMETAALKRDFGRDLVFWGGGVDTQGVLGSGTPAEVRAEVRRRVADLAPGGGFVFASVHNIQANVPAENIVAMWEAAAAAGAYPIAGAAGRRRGSRRMNGEFVVHGRLVLDEHVRPGRVVVRDGWIAEVELDAAEAAGPFIAPGFVDVHVHGRGGHDAMGPEGALDGMARALLRHGVTSFLPTAVTAPQADLVAFAERVRQWMPAAPDDGAGPLGFNLEGPLITPARKGAQNPAHIRAPAEVSTAELEPLLDGLRITTIAPEIPGRSTSSAAACPGRG